MENPFWKHILKQWSDFCHTRTPQLNSELLQLPLWFNSQISPVTLYFPTWQHKGITIIDDIINPEGDIMKSEEIKTKYQLKRIEFDYYKVPCLIRTFKNTYKKATPFCDKPHLPTHIRLLLKPGKVSQSLYQQQNNFTFTESPLCEILWNRSFNIASHGNPWSNIYKSLLPNIVKKQC